MAVGNTAASIPAFPCIPVEQPSSIQRTKHSRAVAARYVSRFSPVSAKRLGVTPAAGRRPRAGARQGCQSSSSINVQRGRQASTSKHSSGHAYADADMVSGCAAARRCALKGLCREIAEPARSLQPSTMPHLLRCDPSATHHAQPQSKTRCPAAGCVVAPAMAETTQGKSSAR